MKRFTCKKSFANFVFNFRGDLKIRQNERDFIVILNFFLCKNPNFVISRFFFRVFWSPKNSPKEFYYDFEIKKKKSR